MKKASKEAIEISTAIARFLNEYAPFHLTQSEETLKSYEDTLKIYINYLETERLPALISAGLVLKQR